ncbi:EF-hand domain pair [Babesia duncani]|uniref:EF-hand domain pair n=1 Tax=Babesia duncani TaxID=323732 RepID=A0AAD9PN40_9APIC|nr:EF-hand domain pair [Babesia duncani]
MSTSFNNIPHCDFPRVHYEAVSARVRAQSTICAGITLPFRSLPFMRAPFCSGLLPIFKALDTKGTGKLDTSSLDEAFTKLLGIKHTQQELEFCLRHLINIGQTGGDGNCKSLDFGAFMEAVNGTCKRQPLASILHGTFKALANGKDVVTTARLVQVANDAKMDVRDDAMVRLGTRMPNGIATFEDFCKCIAKT